MFRNIKYVLASLVMLLAFVVTTNQVEAKSFSDLKTGAAEINYLMDHEPPVIGGYPDGTFKPKNAVTRAEAMKMIGTAIGLNGAQRDTKFKDVHKELFASGFIHTANEKGYISGYADGTFKPHNPITRGEAAIIISNAFGLNEQKRINFRDVPTSHPYHTSINLMASAGITVGYPDQTFQPNREISRVEMSYFIARAMNESFRLKVLESTYDKKEKYVTAPSLNVRNKPGTHGKIIGKLKRNTKVTTHEQHGNWFEITSGNLKGYVHGAYLSKDKQPEQQHIIAIDAGHGGSDPGASGHGIIEKELTLDVAKRVERLLKNSGIQVVMTRSDDRYISLRDRVSIAVNRNADTFVSIHANAFGSSSANGTESYYTNSNNNRAKNSRQLASFIQRELVEALDTRDRGVKTAGFHVIKNNPLPAALIELGFMTNSNDAAKMKSEAYKNKAAEAIRTGIVNYYNWTEG